MELRCCFFRKRQEAIAAAGVRKQRFSRRRPHLESEMNLDTLLDFVRLHATKSRVNKDRKAKTHECD